MKRLIVLSAIFLAGLAAFAQDPCPQITNIPGRSTVCLDGNWKYIVDVYNTGNQDYRANPLHESQSFFADRSFYADQRRLIEYDFDASREIAVPGDWNTQRPELYMYEGTVWYRRKFDMEAKEGKRYFLYFEGANYETVNTERRGNHGADVGPWPHACARVAGLL